MGARIPEEAEWEKCSRVPMAQPEEGRAGWGETQSRGEQDVRSPIHPSLLRPCRGTPASSPRYFWASREWSVLPKATCNSPQPSREPDSDTESESKVCQPTRSPLWREAVRV